MNITDAVITTIGSMGPIWIKIDGRWYGFVKLSNRITCVRVVEDNNLDNHPSSLVEEALKTVIDWYGGDLPELPIGNKWVEKTIA